MSALLKVPFLLGLALTVPVISTSPSPPADRQARERFDQAHSAVGVGVQHTLTRWTPRIYKVSLPGASQSDACTY